MATRTRQDKFQKEIDRTWGNLEVVDAQDDLRVFIQPQDVKKAVEKDPGACVFANACKRAVGSQKVLIFRSVAYVELPREDGKRRVERFLLSPGMRDLIENFDKGKSVIPEAGFLLQRPRPSQTLNSLAKKERERKRRKLAGQRRGDLPPKEKKGRQGDGAGKDKPMVMDLEVRSGTGAVHFSPSKSKGKSK